MLPYGGAVLPNSDYRLHYHLTTLLKFKWQCLFHSWHTASCHPCRGGGWRLLHSGVGIRSQSYDQSGLATPSNSCIKNQELVFCPFGVPSNFFLCWTYWVMYLFLKPCITHTYMYIHPSFSNYPTQGHICHTCTACSFLMFHFGDLVLYRAYIMEVLWRGRKKPKKGRK